MNGFLIYIVNIAALMGLNDLETGSKSHIVILWFAVAIIYLLIIIVILWGNRLKLKSKDEEIEEIKKTNETNIKNIRDEHVKQLRAILTGRKDVKEINEFDDEEDSEDTIVKQAKEIFIKENKI